jgi:hypothetical protein
LWLVPSQVRITAKKTILFVCYIVPYQSQWIHSSTLSCACKLTELIKLILSCLVMNRSGQCLWAGLSLCTIHTYVHIWHYNAKYIIIQDILLQFLTTTIFIVLFNFYETTWKILQNLSHYGNAVNITFYIYMISCFRLRTIDVTFIYENASICLKSNSLTEKQDDTF